MYKRVPTKRIIRTSSCLNVFVLALIFGAVLITSVAGAQMPADDSKRPKVQFWGADVLSGQQVLTSRSTRVEVKGDLVITPWLEGGDDTRQAKDENDARVLVDSRCGMGGWDVGYASWLTNLREEGGRVKYTMNIVWKSCYDGDKTRAFAITGYGDDGMGSAATCPLAGYYGYTPGVGYHEVYDCVKYIGSPPYSRGSSLSCAWGRNEACITGDASVKSQVFISANQPSQQDVSRQRVSYNLSTTLTPSRTGDYHREICQYMRYTAGGAVGGHKCIQVGFKVERRTETFLYGSWAEYGVLANGGVNSSSGAGLSSSSLGRPPLREDEYNKLTFANTPSFGKYGAVPRSSIPPIFLSSGKAINNSNVSLNNLDSGVHYRDGSLNIEGVHIPEGKQIIIRARDDVVINSNIIYVDGSYRSLTSLPQLVILAKNIVISPGVERIDAWLIANGTGDDGYVSTCDVVSSPKDWLDGVLAGGCDKQLKINGPIIANHLYLRRIYGAERDNPGTPAEVINLRPDAYLWAYGYSHNSGAIKTTYIKELPPRF